MAELQFTDVATGNKFTVPEKYIIFVATDTLGASVQYIKEWTGQRYQNVVSETPANIALVSDTLIPVTIVDTLTGSTQVNYVSTTRMGVIDGTGTYVKFDYDVEGAIRRPISVTQTLIQLETLQREKEGQLVYAFDAVSATVDTISLAAAEGDLTATFTNGVGFTAFGSSTAAMNTIWVVSSSAFSGGKTVITVTGSIPANASETGSIWLNA
jgi:hypothetical protein